VALDENGDPIVLREHIRKPHPVRKEASVRAERPGQDMGGSRSNKNAAQPQRKDVRISSERKDAEEFFFESSLDRRGSEQRSSGQKGERRGSEQQRLGNGQSRGSVDRSGGEQPRGGKQQRGGNERSGGESFRGKELQSRGQEQRSGQPRSNSQQRGANNGPRGGEQQRGGHPRGGHEPRGGQQRFDSELLGAADGFAVEGRQQARMKHRKGQKRLPIPPREQTVAATSEAALSQRPKPTGGDNEQSS
jgi:hypothetical protein